MKNIRKSFLPAIVLIALTLGLFLPFTLAYAVKPTGTTPCGSKENPKQVSSPLRLFVNPVDSATKYKWEIEDIDGNFQEITTDTASSPINSKKIDLALGAYSWKITALDETSDTCYIEVTHFCPAGNICIRNPLQSDKFTDIVNNVLTILFNFALVLTPIMVVIAGIMFVTATGDPTRISRAKQILIWTAVGFVIILLARGLVLVLRTIIGF